MTATPSPGDDAASYRAPRRPGSAPRLISQSGAGRLNRTRLLQILYDAGPSSRAGLARLATVTPTTIGSIVQPMIDEGILVEGEPLPSGETGGKPARPIWFSPHGRPVVAVYLGPSTIRAALVSPTGDLLTRTDDAFVPGRIAHDEVLDRVSRCVAAVLPASGPAPLGVGVAVGGTVDTDRGVILEVNLAPRMAGLALGPELSARTGVPVHLDLHPRVQALGDRWFGDGRGVSSFASVYIGEAIGAGFVVDGEIHRGASGAGGEVGHTIVDYGGAICRCGRHGCWETIATHGWLRARAAATGLPDAHRLTAELLVNLAARGVDGAAALADEYARHIAVGLVNIQQTLAPGLFIVHGEVVGGGEPFRALIEAELRRGAGTRPGGEPQLRFASPHDDIVLLGATGLVLSQSLAELA